MFKDQLLYYSEHLLVGLAQMVLQMVLAGRLRGRLVGSPAFVVLLDATRAAARFGGEVPLVVKVQRVWAMVLLP